MVPLRYFSLLWPDHKKKTTLVEGGFISAGAKNIRNYPRTLVKRVLARRLEGVKGGDTPVGEEVHLYGGFCWRSCINHRTWGRKAIHLFRGSKEDQKLLGGNPLSLKSVLRPGKETFEKSE